MADKDRLTPRTPNEVVIPIGKANLVTTKEEADKHLEIAGRIFREQNEEKPMEETDLNKELETSLEAPENTGEVGETNEEELVKLTDEERAALPFAKFGRDEYGRALNKNGTPRKARNDKGVVRGKYGPRKPKNNPVDETPTPAAVEAAADNVPASNREVF